jgi:hypothetical protein
MQRLKSALTALAVGIVLLTALDFAASAATGHAMILGKWNQADHKTVLKNTKQGVALDLRTKNGPVLKVNNSKRIKKLNADKLDGMTGADYKTNRNTLYYWATPAHTGGFSQVLPAQAPGSYLITYSVQLTGAAGDPANPTVINCRVVQSGVSGATIFDKSIIGESTVTSVGTPPALNGTGPAILAAGDSLRLSCTMTRNNQQWSTTPLQPLIVNLLRTDGTNLYGGVLGRHVALKRTTD